MTARLADSPHLLAQLERARAGDRKAADLLLAALEPLLAKCANRFKPEAMEFDDAMQECRLAYLRALRYWKPERSARFATFVVQCCKTAMANHHRSLTRRVRLVTLEPLDDLAVAADPEDHFAPALARVLVGQALALDPPNPGEAIAVNALLAGETCGGMARQVGVTKSAMSGSLRRWIARVRRVMTEEGETDAEDREEQRRAGSLPD